MIEVAARRNGKQMSRTAESSQIQKQGACLIKFPTRDQKDMVPYLTFFRLLSDKDNNVVENCIYTAYAIYIIKMLVAHVGHFPHFE